jgi:hypothetical protein
LICSLALSSCRPPKESGVTPLLPPKFGLNQRASVGSAARSDLCFPYPMGTGPLYLVTERIAGQIRAGAIPTVDPRPELSRFESRSFSGAAPCSQRLHRAIFRHLSDTSHRPPRWRWILHLPPDRARLDTTVLDPPKPSRRNREATCQWSREEVQSYITISQLWHLRYRPHSYLPEALS